MFPLAADVLGEMLLENPWPIVIAAVGVAAVLRVTGKRRGQKGLVVASWVLLVLGVGLVGLARWVETDREAVHRLTAEVIGATSPVDGAAAGGRCGARCGAQDGHRRALRDDGWRDSTSVREAAGQQEGQVEGEQEDHRPVARPPLGLGRGAGRQRQRRAERDSAAAQVPAQVGHPLLVGRCRGGLQPRVRCADAAAPRTGPLQPLGHQPRARRALRPPAPLRDRPAPRSPHRPRLPHPGVGVPAPGGLHRRPHLRGGDAVGAQRRRGAEGCSSAAAPCTP